MKKRTKKRRYQAGKVIGILAMLVGALIICYPDIREHQTEQANTKLIEEFEERMQKSVTNSTGEDAGSGRDDRSDTDGIITGTENLLIQVQAYNCNLYEEGQITFQDAWSVEQAPDGMEELKDGMFGYIDIPTMDCRLPLYVGASYSHMDQGAAVLGETSIPIGGINTNSVIAGHRGWKKGRYFKEIENLSAGDPVYLTNPWETLTYRVESIDIIAPTDSEKLKIQEGKDMVTLITCHPYRSHGKQRYVVYCVRDTTTSGTEQIETDTKLQEQGQQLTDLQAVSSKEDIRMEDVIRRICAVLILGCALIAFISNRKHKKRERSEKTG